MYGSCLAARKSKLVSGMCSMLPYGTGICCYAVIYYFFLLPLSIPFFNTLKKSGIDKSKEWSTIPACPSLIFFFFKRGDTEGTSSSIILCSMFVYVLFYVNLCHD